MFIYIKKQQEQGGTERTGRSRKRQKKAPKRQHSGTQARSTPPPYRRKVRPHRDADPHTPARTHYGSGLRVCPHRRVCLSTRQNQTGKPALHSSRTGSALLNTWKERGLFPVFPIFPHPCTVLIPFTVSHINKSCRNRFLRVSLVRKRRGSQR